MESTESKKMVSFYLWIGRVLWKLILMPWRLLFAFVPPYQIAHGWIAFIGSLSFISGIAYVVTKLTEGISCVTGHLLYLVKKNFLRINILVVFFWHNFVLLSYRNKSLCHSFYSTSQWNLMAWFSCKQDCCWASNHCRFCHC